MDLDFSPSPRLKNEIGGAFPAEKSSNRVVGLIFAAVSVGLLGVLLVWGIPYALPFLKPMSVHFLYRLREVSIFLLFTTVVACGIFNSPWKSVDRQKPCPDQYPLSSIFGETGGSDVVKYEQEGAEQNQRTRPDDYSLARAKAYNAVDLLPNSNTDRESYASGSRKAEDFSVQSLQRKVSEADNFSSREAGKVAASSEKTTPTHRRNLSASREEGYRPVYERDPRPPAPLTTLTKLHRRSSSLDDSVNYEPTPEAEETRSQPNAQVTLPSSTSATQVLSSGSHNMVKPDIGRAKPVGVQKRVSFSMDHDTPNETKSQEGEKHTSLSSFSASQISRTGGLSNKVLPSPDDGENTSGRGEKRVALSPNELDQKADAFIAKFKEQIRMQKLESFQRYRRRLE